MISQTIPLRCRIAKSGFQPDACWLHVEVPSIGLDYFFPFFLSDLETRMFIHWEVKDWFTDWSRMGIEGEGI